MNILHTSDWHLGRTLYGHKRYDEFNAFLNWLADIINEKKIDVLLVAGDIFDTTMPSNKAQELYYRFLCTIAHSSCRHVVVIAGNHDSPSFLDAPKTLLRALDVHVVGTMTTRPEDEVIILKDESNQPQAIICAVPYLRDKDIRTAEAGESIEDKNRKLIDGLKHHYWQVCAVAEQLQAQFKSDYPNTAIPIIGMGHLFAAGGKTIEGDGVRELYVGSLAHVSAAIFPPCLDYLALGHLHVPQRVGQNEHFRYSGSPIPMGFGEAKQQKKVIQIEFNDLGRTITEINVPCFQSLVRICGSLDIIETQIARLKAEDSKAWLEIEYTGNEIVTNLRERIDNSLLSSTMQLRRIKNRRIMDGVINQLHTQETLDDLDAHDVFTRCLDAHNVADDERHELITTYNEIVALLQAEDLNAE